MYIKKKQGRPKKNSKLNLNIKQPNINNNNNNIYPLSNIHIKIDKTKIIDNINQYFIFKSIYPGSFTNIFNLIKTKYKNMRWYIDNTGILIKYFLPKKILIEKMDIEIKFQKESFTFFKIKKPLNIKINIDKLYKIFKTIPKNKEFTFIIKKKYKNLDPEIYNPFVILLKYTSTENDEKDVELYEIDLENFIIKRDIIKIHKDMVYDAICILDVQRFIDKCNDIKTFSRNITIKYINNILFFEFNELDIRFKKKFILSSKFQIIKHSDKIINGKFNISSFIKYIKCKDITSIVKLYLSNIYPLLIEYDINPGLGTIQIMIDHNDIYNNKITNNINNNYV